MVGKTVTFKYLLKQEVKSASIYTLCTFLTQFGSFLVVPLFWKRLSIADYGIIAVTEMIGAFLSMFLGLSLDLAITRFYYEWPVEERKQRVGTLWMLSWASSVALGVSAGFLLSIFSNLLFPSVSFYPFILFGLIIAILNSYSVTLYATIRIANQPLLYLIYSLATFSISLFLNVYFVAVLNKGLQGYYVSNIIGGVIVALIGAIVMMRFAVPCIRLDGLRSNIKFCLPNIPASLISGVTQMVDRLLLQQFATLSVLGIYAVSLKFTNLVLSLHNALKLSYVPYMVKAVEKNRNEGIVNLARMRLYYMLPIFVFCMAIAIFIKDFVYYVNRSEYFPVIQWVPWLIGPVLLSTFTIYLAPGLFLAKRSDKLWIPTAVQLLMVTMGGLLLIPQFQLTGVVINRYISTLTLFAAHIILSQKYYPIPIPWPKLSILMMLIAGGIGVSFFIELNNIIFNIATKGILLFVFSMICLVIVTGWQSVMRALRSHVFIRKYF